MFRIIFPAMIAVAMIFFPLIEETTTGEISGTKTTPFSAKELFLEAPYDCALNGQFNPLDEKCAPEGDLKGWGLYAATAAGIVAGVVGILGLLPFLGRLVSFVTTIAGGIATAGVGNFIAQLAMNPDVGIQAIQWGGWVAIAASVLTLIAGFSGMGNRD